MRGIGENRTKDRAAAYVRFWPTCRISGGLISWSPDTGTGSLDIARLQPSLAQSIEVAEAVELEAAQAPDLRAGLSPRQS